MEDQRYAGFWIRVLATVIDTVIVMLILSPSMMMLGIDESTPLLSSIDVVLNLGIIALTIAFWIYKGATPRKILTKIKIVDEKTVDKLTAGQSINRYFGYIIGTIPLSLGFFWIGFDKKKQGWHDKLARSIVVYVD